MAYVVCSGVGLECSTTASDYIQLYQGDREQLAESLGVIRKCAAAVLDALLVNPPGP